MKIPLLCLLNYVLNRFELKLSLRAKNERLFNLGRDDAGKEFQTILTITMNDIEIFFN